ERLHDAGVQWADFGTRRRFSYDVQEAVVRHMTGVPGFAGTSNPHLAMMFDTRPIGTYAHECVMAMQVLHGFSNCNRAWMDAWVKEYE
ncbi:nicotinate phosphoribosyltransferase, partial [Acinetobacter baumannii]